MQYSSSDLAKLQGTINDLHLLGFGQARCEIEKVPYTAGRDPREHEPFIRQCFLDLQENMIRQVQVLNRQIDLDIFDIQNGVSPKTIMERRFGSKRHKYEEPRKSRGEVAIKRHLVKKFEAATCAITT